MRTALRHPPQTPPVSSQIQSGPSSQPSVAHCPNDTTAPAVCRPRTSHHGQNPDGAEVDADTAECIVAKNRHGETSTVPLGWDGAHTRFMDVDFKR